MVDTAAEDGSRAPHVAEQVRVALAGAGAARGFAVAERPGRWVDATWRGRRLLVLDSPYAGDAPTSGPRGVAIGLSTRSRGRWRGAPAARGSAVLGAALPLSPVGPGPDGTWADDPGLAAELWWFAERLLPTDAARDQAGVDAVVQLHARPDAVVWHLRADAVHPHVVVEALDLLEQVAVYGEADDEHPDGSAQPSGPGMRVLITRVLAGLVILAMILLAAAPLLR